MMLKRWLEIKDIGFSETDITENEDARNKVLDAGRMSLPVLEINNEFVDYNEFNDIVEMI